MDVYVPCMMYVFRREQPIEKIEYSYHANIQNISEYPI